MRVWKISERIGPNKKLVFLAIVLVHVYLEWYYLTMTYTTIPAIASELGLSVSKVHYILKKLGIRPMAHAGSVGLYAPGVIDEVKAGLGLLRRYERR